jgi:hypothetical protein
MPNKRMPVRRKATGNQRRDGCASKRPVVDNWPDTRQRVRSPDAWLRKQADVWQVSL